MDIKGAAIENCFQYALVHERMLGNGLSIRTHLVPTVSVVSVLQRRIGRCIRPLSNPLANPEAAEE